MANTLYFGDNLDILRERVKDEVADLIYLDPPFNSRAQYNLIFDRPTDDAVSAQAGAFRDTWTWGEDAEWSFDEMMRIGGASARLVDALRSALGESDMMAYLVMMAVRMQELRRVLKPTGSLYLHCDPTASHYLKVLLDATFGADKFLNEIVWQRTGAHNDAKRFGRVTDSILLFTKSANYTFYPQYVDYDPEYIEERYRYRDPDGRRFWANTATSPNPRPNMMYEWKGCPSPPNGWRFERATMERMDQEGRLYYSKSGMVYAKNYLDEQKGRPVQNLWNDIVMSKSGAERLGYPTQKPLALLKRIVLASSDKGDLVLDPFCGCGTTIEAAQHEGRQWIGIDVAVHAIKVIEARLSDRFDAAADYRVEGMPRDFASAVRLAEKDKYQFQWWANYLFNPHALREQKRGADRGIDGELFFPNGPGRTWGRMLTSVKGGENIGPAPVREFARVLDREKADLGLFIFLHKPTRAMVTEASSVGFARTIHGQIPRLQLVSIEEWFKGKLPALPPLEHLPSAALSATRRRPKAPGQRPDPKQPQLPLVFTGAKSKDVTRHFNPSMVKVQLTQSQESLAV